MTGLAVSGNNNEAEVFRIRMNEMNRKRKVSVFFLLPFMLAALSLATDKGLAETVQRNVFERFRVEMTVSHDRAAPKFMSKSALNRWNQSFMPLFDKRDRQLSQFFAFSLMMPKMKGPELFVVYFNPWVDGALLTRWKQSGDAWKMEDFYMASGERVRGELRPKAIASEDHTLPVWMRFKGPILRGITAYYKDMSAWLLSKGADDFNSWFLLDEGQRNLDLQIVKSRMQRRLAQAIGVIVPDRIGPILSGAISRLKYDTLTKARQNLAGYSPHADLLIEMPQEITKTWRENWYFKSGNIYTLILSSPIQPRMFLFMNVHDTGKIQGVLLGDLEIMADLLRKAAPQRAKPVAETARKVQRYKTANGDQVEIVTQRQGGRVIMTTRINGTVTEVLKF